MEDNIVDTKDYVFAGTATGFVSTSGLPRIVMKDVARSLLENGCIVDYTSICASELVCSSTISMKPTAYIALSPGTNELYVLDADKTDKRNKCFPLIDIRAHSTPQANSEVQLIPPGTRIVTRWTTNKNEN